MKGLFRQGLLYGLAFALVVLVTSAACFWLLGTSYAGVTDDAVVEAGATAHAAYLRTVGGAVARLVVFEIAALGGLSFGLLALRRKAREEKRAPGLTLLAFAGLALLVHLAWLGAQARRHPGLLLPMLSASAVVPVWVALSRLLWPAILGGSIAGWIRLAIAAKTTALRGAGVVGSLFAIAWFWVLETGRADRSMPAPEAHARAASSARAARARPNVLLIGIDSLRPDKIDEKTTPVLARLRAESIYFPNTLVTVPRTAPSWVALLTSLPPLANGVETMFPSPERSDLADLAMPAHLASLGYATQVASEYAGEFFDRVSVGFERRSVPRVELEQILGQALLGRQPAALALAGQLYAASQPLRRFLPAPVPDLLRGFASFSHPSVLEEDLVAGLDPKRPWFALVFYSQPHFPYTSSSPFYERFAVEGSDPALRFGKDVMRGDVRTRADRAQIEALYRGALAETDAAIGDLLARLDGAGELDDTIVIVTADHGEGLYECPTCVGHGDNLTSMTTLKVPLAFRLPRRRYPSAAAGNVDRYVSQLDVYPTVLSLLGAPPLPIHEGAALLANDGRATVPDLRTFFVETGEWLWPTPAVPAERLVYPPITVLAEVARDRIVIGERFLPVIRAAKHRAAIRPPWKLVYRPGPKGATWSLYDVERDPLDTTDVGGENAEVFAELKGALVHSVLRFSHMVAVGDHFLTRPPAPPEEYY
jgi:hypothetical protein